MDPRVSSLENEMSKLMLRVVDFTNLSAEASEGGNYRTVELFENKIYLAYHTYYYKGLELVELLDSLIEGEHERVWKSVSGIDKKYALANVDTYRSNRESVVGLVFEISEILSREIEMQIS